LQHPFVNQRLETNSFHSLFTGIKICKHRPHREVKVTSDIQLFN
jgi:hypothetical protein